MWQPELEDFVNSEIFRIERHSFTLGSPSVVVHVGDSLGGVPDLVVHDGVHEHRHAVLGQDLEL